MCLLDLETSTRPHMVANITVSDSKILCIAAVPSPVEAARSRGPDSEEQEGSGMTSLLMESEVEDQAIPIKDLCVQNDENSIPIEGQEIPNGDNGGHVERGDVLMTELRGVPEDKEESLELCGSDSAHPAPGHESRPHSRQGSATPSFSSECSSDITGLSISRTPSMASNHSDRQSSPDKSVRSEVTRRVSHIAGMVSEVLDAIPAFGSRDKLPAAREKNGFHRVRSNSVPDLTKMAVLNCPDLPPDAYRTSQDRVTTSLSPSHHIDTKFWSPLTLRPSASGQKAVNKPPGGSSMWLGTEGGKILVYSAGSNLRSRNNRHTVQLPAPVHCIRYAC